MILSSLMASHVKGPDPERNRRVGRAFS